MLKGIHIIFSSLLVHAIVSLFLSFARFLGGVRQCVFLFSVTFLWYYDDVVVIYFYISLLLFRLNTTTIKSHSHFTMYNEFIDLNALAVCYMLMLWLCWPTDIWCVLHVLFFLPVACPYLDGVLSARMAVWDWCKQHTLQIRALHKQHVCTTHSQCVNTGQFRMQTHGVFIPEFCRLYMSKNNQFEHRLPSTPRTPKWSLPFIYSH
jgi:hypothetical protein